jgi:hypothetical protein
MKTLFLTAILVCVTAVAAIAQRQTIFVNPQTTDPQIDTFLSPHYVARDPGVAQRNQLMVFLPGTNGVPAVYRAFTNLAADMGFHTIGLNYVNGQGVNEMCGPTLDLDCYGNVRLEILDGTDRSGLVSVNRANSIENRLIKLLIHMQEINPAANWAQYLDGGSIRWDKIVIAGHSQGGGHAGIIGKTRHVMRVLMFAAMDFNGFRNSVANWMLLSGVTPDAGFFGFSHQQDEEVNYTVLSTRAWTAYGMDDFGAPVNVDAAAPPYSNTHSLNTNFPDIPNGSNYHGAIIVDTRFPVDQNGVSIYEPAWRYLLNTNAPLNVTSIQFRRVGQAVNRPAPGRSTKLFKILLQGGGFNAGSRVIVDGIEVAAELAGPAEVIADLPAGKARGMGHSTVQVRNQDGATSNSIAF